MRFTDRTQTIQEVIWQNQGEEGNVEAIVLWLESRLDDENRYLDIRSMPETELPLLVRECLQGCKRAAEVTEFLEGLEKSMETE
jgi:hypothetical protein